MVPFILYQEAVDENENRNAVRILRLHLRETQDPFGIPDIVFKNFYRLPKALVQELIADIEPAMEVAQRVTAIPNHLKVLAFLSVVANGGYQKNVGHDFLLALSQTTVSRCIDLVARAIQNILAPRRIVFPVGAHEKTVIKTKFYNKFRFPGIIGAIDGTHIRIQKPDQQVEHVYYNGRKGAHTKNVQIICDLDLKILNINARYGGTAHDSYIWSTSQARRHMVELHQQRATSQWLIGDSGYEQRAWLMTPIRNPVNEYEEAYNVAHRKARNCVERCIGVLKGRFRILGKDRILRYSPAKSGVIINACAVLHNIMIEAGIPIETNLEIENDEEIEDEEHVNINEANANELQAGVAARQRLVTDFFS